MSSSHLKEKRCKYVFQLKIIKIICLFFSFFFTKSLVIKCEIDLGSFSKLNWVGHRTKNRHMDRQLCVLHRGLEGIVQWAGHHLANKKESFIVGLYFKSW